MRPWYVIGLRGGGVMAGLGRPLVPCIPVSSQGLVNIVSTQLNELFITYNPFSCEGAGVDSC